MSAKTKQNNNILEITTNLTHLARAGLLDPVAGREKEMDVIIEILCRRTKSNPLLYGESGTGKTAIIEGLAQKINQQDIPKSFKNKEILQLNLDTLIAVSKNKGDLQTRLKDLIIYLLNSPWNILFIDDINNMFSYSHNFDTDLVSIFKPYLDHGQLSIISTTTITGYRNLFERNKNLERNFQPVFINEPDDEIALEMLKQIRPKFEKFHSVRIPGNMLKVSIALSKRYIAQRFLPDKAIDLIDEAASDIKIEIENGERNNNLLKRSDLEKIISKSTGIPITRLTDEESEKMLSLEKLIHKKFVGQEEAVKAISNAIRRGRIGINSSARPIASLIFVGSSGTGKSELIKVLGELVFNRNDAVITIDMSEYMEKHDLSKLTGSAPGYVGYEEGGILTEAVKDKPYSIVLFDNIDKAHPSVLLILLQLLEEGHLTDSKGASVSFANTIIICTTNAGAGLLSHNKTLLDMHINKENIESILKEMKTEAKRELLKNFSAELLNRFDEVILFYPLFPENMLEIARLNIAKTAALLKDHNFNLQITDQALNRIAHEGYDADFGARPVRGIIRNTIENPVTMAIIAKEFIPGDTILVDYVPEKGFSLSRSAVDILLKTNISLPGIQDIARIDELSLNHNSANAQKIENFKDILKKINDPSLIPDDIERMKFQKLREALTEENKYGNPTAIAITIAVQNVQKITKSGNKQNVSLPISNKIQLVTEEDFLETKKIWEENYKSILLDQTSLDAKINLIKKDIESTQNTLSLFTSSFFEDDHALQMVSYLLPFLLIGGFTKDEIIEYLKIKIDAAKTVLDKLTEEEETILPVKRSHQIPQTQTPLSYI